MKSFILLTSLIIVLAPWMAKAAELDVNDRPVHPHNRIEYWIMDTSPALMAKEVSLSFNPIYGRTMIENQELLIAAHELSI